MDQFPVGAKRKYSPSGKLPDKQAVPRSAKDVGASPQAKQRMCCFQTQPPLLRLRVCKVCLGTWEDTGGQMLAGAHGDVAPMSG